MVNPATNDETNYIESVLLLLVGCCSCVCVCLMRGISDFLIYPVQMKV